MPRPLRLEYEHAYYHVMNRGRGRQAIFHGRAYYEAFLATLEEVYVRFRCIVHAYCLMGNHYHLLIETPDANLSRVMRHVNGVYTQRYNRLRNTDGPLFRGRFKAILVDADAYLLRLSRYIHRNPIETKIPLVKELSKYQWSSYPAYIGAAPSPPWLEREQTYGMLGKKQRYVGYADYVMQGLDEDTAKFYRKGNVASLIGDEDFREYVFTELMPSLKAEQKVRIIRPDIKMKEIVTVVAKAYGVTIESLLSVTKGPQKENKPRKVAMYLCQELGSAKLTDIATHFELGNAGSVSFITHQIRKRRQADKKFARRLESIVKQIT